MNRNAGLLIVAVGAGVVLLGVLVWVGAFGWFGRLPGDIRYEGENSRVYIPITSGIVASVVLTIVANVVIRLLR